GPGTRFVSSFDSTNRLAFASVTNPVTTKNTTNSKQIRFIFLPLSGLGSSLNNAHNHDRHIIVLLCPSCESISGIDDKCDRVSRSQTVTRLRSFDELFLSPLFIIRVHRLADPVRERQKEIAGFHLNRSLSVRKLREQPYNRAASSSRVSSHSACFFLK